MIKIWSWYCVKASTPDRTGEHHWNNLLKQTGCWLGHILLSISNHRSQHADVSKIYIFFLINRCCCNAAGCYLWSVCCWLNSGCQPLAAKRQDVSKYWQCFDLLFLNTPQPINTANQLSFPVLEVITESTHLLPVWMSYWILASSVLPPALLHFNVGHVVCWLTASAAKQMKRNQMTYNKRGAGRRKGQSQAGMDTHGAWRSLKWKFIKLCKFRFNA